MQNTDRRRYLHHIADQLTDLTLVKGRRPLTDEEQGEADRLMRAALRQFHGEEPGVVIEIAELHKAVRQ